MNMYSPYILEKKLDDHMRSFLSENAWDFNKSLYHYTSYEGLKGILGSRRLWQTDFFSLNDPSEIKHGLKFIEDLFAERYDKNYAVAKKFIEIFRNMVEQGLKLFVTSFCGEGDYLPNWRYYGGAGAGYSIGFKGCYFRPENKSPEVRSRMFTKIFYSPKYEEIKKINHTEFLKNEVERWHLYIMKFFEIVEQCDQTWYVCKNLQTTLASYLILTLPAVKNLDYQNEKEWRTILPRLCKDSLCSPMDFPTQGIRLDSRKIEADTPFLKSTSNTIVRIETEQFCYSDISEIYVGPRLDFMAAKFGIEKILRDAGADECTIKNINIRQSEKSFQ